MTKPWWGVTPPPRGQGYYPPELDQLPDNRFGNPPYKITTTTNTGPAEENS